MYRPKFHSTAGSIGMFSINRRNEGKRRCVLGQAIEALEGRVLLAYTLDPTFDGDGLLTGPASFGAGNVTVQSDGKIIITAGPLTEGVGSSLFRYNSSGTLDTSFGGGDGRVDPPNGTFFGPLALSGNKIVIGASRGEDDVQYVYRYNLDGTLDTSFGGGDGIAEVHRIMSLGGLAVQGDGKIAVAGAETNFSISSHDPTSRTAVFDTQTVTRLNADGSVDTSFGGGDGYVSALMDSGDHFIAGIGIQPGTGNIVVAGSDSSAEHVIATAWSPNGTYLFRGTAPNMKGVVTAMGFQPSGSIILASADGSGPSQGSLARLSATGQYDSSFAGGNNNFPIGFTDLEVLADGRILGSGTALDTDGTHYDALVRRFTANGAIDQTFAPGGFVRADWEEDNFGISLDAASDGKIVLGGSGSSPENPRVLGLARFADLPQTPFTGSPFQVGQTIQAEDFDLGGEGVAYHDKDVSNNGGAYRPSEGVDIQATTDSGGGYNVGWTNSGEWIEYTINIPTTGAYSIGTRLASYTNGSMHYEIDGQDVTGSFQTPATGGWQNWATITHSLGTLTAGTHVLRLVNGTGATNFNWLKISATDGGGGGTVTGLKGEYFNNMDFTAPVLTRNDANINFNWGTGSPAAGVDADTFSVRWTGQIQAPTSGRYTFYTTTDDGVRLWVHNQLIIDHLTPQAATEWSGAIDLVAGQKYNIRMEYFDRFGGAQAKLSWSGPGITKTIVPPSAFGSSGDSQPPSAVTNFHVTNRTDTSIALAWNPASDNQGVTGYQISIDNAAPVTLGSTITGYTFNNLQPGSTHTFSVHAFDAAGNHGPLASVSGTTTGTTSTNGLRGEYFNNMDFTAPVFTRTDGKIDFNWGTGSPASNMDADTFSVRWSGQIQAPATGRYTFYTTSDDGARLTINGQRIIDKLVPQATTEWSGSIDLVAGQKYSITLEYIERAGGANVKLQWAGPNISKQVVPQSQLFS